VYGQICEGHWDPSDLGYNILHPLKGQIKEYGNTPILMGQSIVPILESALLSGISKAKISNQINQLQKNPDMNCSPRGRDLMIGSAKRILVGIQHGIVPTSIEHSLYKVYSDLIYVKDFESRIQDISKHYKGASKTGVRELLEDIRPYVERGRTEFANQLVKYKDVKKLRRPRHLKEQPLTIDDSAW
jgi:hypothetical protein